MAAYRDAVRHGDRRHMPGPVRASASLATSASDIDRFIKAAAAIPAGAPTPVGYETPTPATSGPAPPTSRAPARHAAGIEAMLAYQRAAVRWPQRSQPPTKPSNRSASCS
jgi:hypothetical protein